MPALDGLVVPDHVSDVKVTRTSVEDMVEKILGEKFRINRETKLTWGGNGKRVPNDKVSGEFNGRLEYIRIGRGAYWIQNGKIFNGAKRRVKLAEVDDFYRPYVEEAFGNFKRQAIAADDALCPRCLDEGNPFVAANHEEYAKHVITKHPSVALDELETEPAVTRVIPVGTDNVAKFENYPVAEGRTTPKVFTSNKYNQQPKATYICGVCNKSTPTERGLKIHTSRTHKG